jgi:predicted amidohydrolase YtcJ
VTTAQDGNTSEQNYNSLLAALSSNPSDLPIRVQILPDYALAKSRRLPVDSGEAITPDNRLILGPTKLFVDGSLQGYTGFLANPYHQVMYDLGKTWRGYPTIDYFKLSTMVRELHISGRQIAIHANGDNAISMVIEAYEEALQKHLRFDHRHFIIHCQTVREDQLEKMSQLGIFASFFAVHIHYWGDRHRDIFLGRDRAARLNPLATAASRSITFSLHNDSPITPIDPLRSIQTAVTRKTLGGDILGQEYRITPLEALRAVTINAAFLAFENQRKGRLAPGFLADLAILNGNPLSVPIDKIAQIKVLATLVGGELVYGEL